MKRDHKIPTSFRLQPDTIKLLEAKEKRVRKSRTEIIEGSVLMVLELSESAISLLELAAKTTGKKESKILEECVLAQLHPKGTK
jgi:hypothetical protein